MASNWSRCPDHHATPRGLGRSNRSPKGSSGMIDNIFNDRHPRQFADQEWDKQRGPRLANGHDPAPLLPEPADPLWPKPLGQDAYHGIVGEIVRTIEPHTEADSAALLLHALTAAGNCL